MLIDMADPSDRNTSVKVAEKLSKYKDPEIEIMKMWGLKTITVPVVIGAFGIVKKGIEKHIYKIPGKINITELQKIAPLESFCFCLSCSFHFPALVSDEQLITIICFNATSC